MPFLRKKREEPRIELTPMVDVVFLLLIFFMISTTFVETPGLSVNLPESSSKLAEKEPEEIKVYLSKEGEIHMKGERLTLDALRVVLSSYGEKRGSQTFLLLADRETYHGRVVEVMDAAREAGFFKLAIATESRPEAP